ncbi:MAG TPA: hypothetical protein VNI34_00275 [Candidatus Nitrosotalea sp.]|nr:hypothetical protein [Candidatus Nitrosotalea sp.]
MCTVKSPNEIMVCDVARDRVRDLLLQRLGDSAQLELVHGEGTRVACVDPSRTVEFQASIKEALEWEEDGFRTLPEPPA